MAEERDIISEKVNELARQQERLIDKFGREVKYVRMSVTDRCDFRCVYCMDEEMTFVPRSEVLTLEEMELIAEAFVELGVDKIRLTGGEPLIRANVLTLCEALGLLSGLENLVMTTNGSQLYAMAKSLKEAGVKRLNISLDSLKEARFKNLTRVGDLNKVLRGIDAAVKAGFERIKLNAVILKGRNDDEILDLVSFAIQKGIDITFIEEMPLGLISEHSRKESFCSSDEIKSILQKKWDLTEVGDSDISDGPSKYFHVNQKSKLKSFAVSNSLTKVGFISPHSHNFCHECNRVRVTAEGRLLLCLGHEHSVDLREGLRMFPGDKARLKKVIIDAMDLKPERHEFDHSDTPDIVRFMNMTGG